MAGINGISTGLYQQMNTYRMMNTMINSQNSLGSYSKVGQSFSSSSSGSGVAAGGLDTESLSFVKSYQKGMTDMMQAASSLLETSSGSVLRDMSVSSSNTTVATASANWKPTEAASYTVSVKQLAAAQVNQSSTIDITGSNLSGNLTLQTTAGSFQFNADASSGSNRESLNSLVEQINKAKTGVTASISLKDDKASLVLTSDKTGESSAFRASGSLAEATGLDKATTAAKNAIYTTQKEGSYTAPRERTSETNSVSVDDAFRLTANLKSTGTTSIQTAPDTAKTANAIQKLVDSFNSNLKLLNDNADRGTGVLRQMRRMVIPPTSEKSMNLIGVSTNKDGTLSFDAKTFNQAMQKDPAFARQIIGGSFGLANGVYNDAKQGLQVSSNSLLSEDIRNARLSAAYSPFSTQNTYNRNGAFNSSSNYALNILSNMLI